MPTSKSTRTPQVAPAAVIAADRSRDIARVVHHEGQVGMARQDRRDADLVRADHLVGDQDARHTGGRHRRGLPDRGDGYANRAGTDLQQRDVGALLHLGVRPQLRDLAVKRGHHRRDVAVHQVHVDDQGRGLQAVQRRHPDAGRTAPRRALWPPARAAASHSPDRSSRAVAYGCKVTVTAPSLTGRSVREARKTGRSARGRGEAVLVKHPRARRGCLAGQHDSDVAGLRR